MHSTTLGIFLFSDAGSAEKADISLDISEKVLIVIYISFLSSYYQ